MRGMFRGTAIAALTMGLAALAGCATSPSPESNSEGPLLPTLQVTTGSGVVRFALQVTNVSESPVELNFRTGQSAEFVVRRGGEEIWRWSDDQMFTQALRREVLGPGESRTYEAEWRPSPGQIGQLSAVGTLTATDHQVEQAVQFELP